MQYAIVTGDSRGLGEAVAKQLMEKNVNVIGVSRNKNDSLQAHADERQVNYLHIASDLSDPTQVETCLDQIVEVVFHDETHYVYVVNNAGMIEPIETVGSLDPEMTTKHIQLNLATPILLVNRLLNEANSRAIQMSVINVTSGAAEKTIHGWSVYGSAKAGINHFTQTVALEQEGRGHIILAYSPGVMDTDMQGEIRSSSPEAFADVDKFKQMKEEGTLRSPDEVAAVLMDLLNEPEKIENGKIYKLYDLVDE